MARIAGLNPSAAICEIMNEDGTMARLPELKIFAEKTRFENHLRRRPCSLPHSKGNARAPRRRNRFAD